MHKFKEFSWTPEYQQAFDALLTKLLTAPIMIVFNPEARSKMWCDASNFAIGAVLMPQNMLDGPEQPVEYLFKWLNAAEYNYSATGSKFIGLIQALCSQQYYLLGPFVTVHTGHASLQQLTIQPHLPYQQVYWLQFISESNHTISLIPGKENVVADILSRHYDLDPTNCATIIKGTESDLLDAIKRAQKHNQTVSFGNLKKQALASEYGMYMHER